jgi:peptidoglycan hydrolase-like protein with peptidoglycan-binding domain
MTIGVDYASVDENAKPDFAAAKKAGAQFVIARGVYGRSVVTNSSAPFRDPVWARDKDAITQAGLLRGAYLFVCYPKAGIQTPSPEDQAQAFIDYVKLDSGKDLVPMFDVEQESTLNAKDMFDWTARVCRTLKAAYGTWPGMYTSARVWTEYLKDHPAGELAECPLWIAKPWPYETRTAAHLDGLPGYAPKTIPQFGDATTWLLYQYQGDATGFPGFSSTVDISRMQTLARDAKGDMVRWIQRRLGLAADGGFGPLTETAVKAFQSKHGLVADGIVGPRTLTAISWALPAAPLV